VKNPPKMWPNPCLSKLLRTFLCGKSSLDIYSTFEIFKKLLNLNNCPLDENLANLVTLVCPARHTRQQKSAPMYVEVGRARSFRAWVELGFCQSLIFYDICRALHSQARALHFIQQKHTSTYLCLVLTRDNKVIAKARRHVICM
jgi:hypothetical protein